MLRASLHVFVARLNRHLVKLRLKMHYSYAESNYFVTSFDNSVPRQGPIYINELVDIGRQLGCLHKEEVDMGVVIVSKHSEQEQVPYRYGMLATTAGEYELLLPVINAYKAEFESVEALQAKHKIEAAKREATRQAAFAAHIAKTDAIRAAKAAELQAQKLQAQREGRYVPTELEKLLDTGLTGLTGIALNQHIDKINETRVTAAVTNELEGVEVIDDDGVGTGMDAYGNFVNTMSDEEIEEEMSRQEEGARARLGIG